MNKEPICKNLVKCEECRHFIEKSDAQVVRVDSDCGYGVKNIWGTAVLEDFRYAYSGYVFFCPMHKKPFDKITAYYNSASKEGRPKRYYKTIPETSVEVSENGKPIPHRTKT